MCPSEYPVELSHFQLSIYVPRTLAYSYHSITVDRGLRDSFFQTLSCFKSKLKFRDLGVCLSLSVNL